MKKAKKLTCAHCYSEITDGVIVEGKFYCDATCAENNRLDRADALAQSEGFGTYEDMMESRGATILYDCDFPQREY